MPGVSIHPAMVVHPKNNTRDFDPKVDPQTRTAQARIELANPGQQLKIGMYVDLAFAAPGDPRSTVPVVPVAAVQNKGNGQVIFVATPK